jgi:hypothetical protein
MRLRALVKSLEAEAAPGLRIVRPVGDLRVEALLLAGAAHQPSIRIALSPQWIGVPKRASVPVAMGVSNFLATRGPENVQHAARVRGVGSVRVREPLRAPAREGTRTPMPAK